MLMGRARTHSLLGTPHLSGTSTSQRTLFFKSPAQSGFHETMRSVLAGRSQPWNGEIERARSGGHSKSPLSDSEVFLNKPVNNVALGAMQNVTGRRVGDTEGIGHVSQRGLAGRPIIALLNRSEEDFLLAIG